jgi:hypothetical protein
MLKQCLFWVIIIAIFGPPFLSDIIAHPTDSLLTKQPNLFRISYWHGALTIRNSFNYDKFEKAITDSPIRIMPESLSVTLAFQDSSGRYLPTLSLSTKIDTSVCCSLSQIHYSVENRKDGMIVNIRGFDLIKKHIEVPCKNFTTTETCSKVRLPDFSKLTERMVFIVLASDTFKIKLMREAFFIDAQLMNPGRLRLSGYSSRLKGIPSNSARLWLFPNDVVMLYLSGSHNSEKNYTKDLLQIAHKWELLLANEKYPSIVLNDANIVYVIGTPKLVKALTDEYSHMRLEYNDALQTSIMMERASIAFKCNCFR